MKHLILIPIFFCSFLTGIGQRQLKVITFNIRYDNPADGEYGWPQRLPLVDSVIRQEKPGIIGFQEALKTQVKDLRKIMKSYAMEGAGRDDGKKKGEYSAVFFRKDRFEKITGSTFWLSETSWIPGSRSWGAACTRIVTWVKLKEKQTGKIFFFFNTHFDHASSLARNESAKVLLKKITEIAGTETSIITGDFNDTVNSSMYHRLTTGPDGLADCRKLSVVPPEGPDYTYIGFPFAPEKGDAIDFIFLKNKQLMRVIRHRVITFHHQDKYPSDHLPVCAEIDVPIN